MRERKRRGVSHEIVVYDAHCVITRHVTPFCCLLVFPDFVCCQMEAIDVDKLYFKRSKSGEVKMNWL